MNQIRCEYCDKLYTGDMAKMLLEVHRCSQMFDAVDIAKYGMVAVPGTDASIHHKD